MAALQALPRTRTSSSGAALRLCLRLRAADADLAATRDAAVSHSVAAVAARAP